MKLAASEILKEVKKGNIVISGFDEKNLNPESYDLTLHPSIMTYQGGVLDAREYNQVIEREIPEEGVILLPNVLYLARTNEYTETHGFHPEIVGKSSIGRLGLAITQQSGYGDNGFKGFWTMTISVVQPLRIYPNMKICQIYYDTIKGDTSKEYNGKYQNAKDIMPSKNYEDN